MIRRLYNNFYVNTACAVLFIPLLAAAEDSPVRQESPRSVNRGLFGLDLDIRDGGVGLQVGPIRLRVGDEPPAGPQKIAWLFRRREVIGTPVYDDVGKNVGHIDEFVVDVRNGQIRYAAVEFTSALKRDKLFAVPWNSLTLYRSKAGTYFRIDVPADKLLRAPGFHRNKWPNVGNRRWAEAIDVYYGVVVKPGDLKTEFGTELKPLAKVPHLMRSGDIVGIRVDNLSGKKMGTVADLIVDFATRRVRYGILKMDGIGLAEKRFPVRIDSLDLKTDDAQDSDERFVLHIEHALLGRAPFFGEDTWPNIRDPRWSADVDRYYGVKQPIPKPRVERQDKHSD